MSRLILLAVLLLAATLTPLQAAEDPGEAFGLELEGGTAVPIERFGAGGDRILWLPSEEGIVGEPERALAAALAGQGLEVWLVDPLAAYFLAPGRSSLIEVPVEEMAEVIARAQPGAGAELFVMSSERGAALALMAIAAWQLTYPGQPHLGGAILLNPNLMADTPAPGEPARYLPIADSVALPIYLIQPLHSAKRWYVVELVERLAAGGSEVFVQALPGASDEFHVRPDATEYERRLRTGLAPLLRRATELLAGQRVSGAAIASEGAVSAPWAASTPEPGLHPYTGDPTPPPLRLPDLDGEVHTLDAYRGQVVLVNFWATWCPPCVEEIPSLGRLQALLAGRGFVVLSVDVGESPERVRAFLARVPADFPVLLDSEGETVQPWRIRAFPTTFLVDRAGRIRFGYYGALEWDAPSVVATIEGLLGEGPAAASAQAPTTPIDPP